MTRPRIGLDGTRTHGDAKIGQRLLDDSTRWMSPYWISSFLGFIGDLSHVGQPPRLPPADDPRNQRVGRPGAGPRNPATVCSGCHRIVADDARGGSLNRNAPLPPITRGGSASAWGCDVHKPRRKNACQTELARGAGGTLLRHIRRAVEIGVAEVRDRRAAAAGMTATSVPPARISGPSQSISAASASRTSTTHASVLIA